MVSGPYLLTPLPDLDNIHTIAVHDPRVCHDLDPSSYLQGQVHCAHIQKNVPQNRCPGHNSSLPCWIWILFHTIVVKDPRVCHDIGPKSYLEGQGHSTHIVLIFVRPITPYCHVWYGWYLTQWYRDFRSWSYRQGQGHSSHIAKMCFWAINFHR